MLDVSRAEVARVRVNVSESNIESVKKRGKEERVVDVGRREFPREKSEACDFDEAVDLQELFVTVGVRGSAPTCLVLLDRETGGIEGDASAPFLRVLVRRALNSRR